MRKHTKAKGSLTPAGLQLAGQHLPDLIHPRCFDLRSWRLSQGEMGASDQKNILQFPSDTLKDNPRNQRTPVYGAGAGGRNVPLGVSLQHMLHWLRKAMGLCRCPEHGKDSQLLAGRPPLSLMLVCWASGMACRTSLLEVSSI